MKIIGVTGGIGTGKSSVCSILESLGAAVIDADQLTREIYKEKNVIDELVQYFGEGILKEGAEVDRKELGQCVFGHPDQLQVLNRITHKYIIHKILKNINSIEEQTGYSSIVIEAAIPLEHGFMDTADEIWVVTARLDTRVKRVVKRNGIPPEEALKRIRSQRSEEDYLKIAHHIILNDGGLEELKEQVLKIYKPR